MFATGYTGGGAIVYVRSSTIRGGAAGRRRGDRSSYADIEARIGAVAARQHGVVTHRQLIAAGLTPSQVEGRVAAGLLRRMQRGVFILGHLTERLEPEGARVMAAVLACGKGTLASHATAGALHQLLEPPPRSAPVDVRMAPGRTPSARPGIRAHRSLAPGPGDRTVIDRIPTTSAARTVVDLAAILRTGELERCIARAERRGLLRLATLKRILAREPGRRGARRLREILALERGPAFLRSELEALFLELLKGTGLPPPEINVRLNGREIDFLWRDLGLAVELDGFRDHGSRRAFNDDRRRDAELLAAGIVVLRLTWDDVVERPKETLVRLARVIARREG